MIITGNCLEVMKTLDTSTIDAIVTDPPYGLSFMGKNWDHAVPGVPFWQEALRVAKPGCHILAAGGSRTYHRLAVAIEDAGWEIRDCVMWIYGSGFPKSHDVSKAIDREAGAEREVVGKSSRHVSGKPEQRTAGLAGSSTFAETVGMGAFLTTPATEAAKQWQGWGTALKPAFEPFILARKPLDGTVAQNVQRHGCGGLNVDGCRVGTDGGTAKGNPPKESSKGVYGNGINGKCGIVGLAKGRWPANVIHDGSDEVLAGFENTEKYNRPGGFRIKTGGIRNTEHLSGLKGTFETKCFNDTGSAARFFYCPKASKSEREAGLDGMEERTLQAHGDFNGTEDHAPKLNIRSRNHHPTVKPVALMAYLCRLITPPNGIILDPFCGSGSTGVAAVREGFNFIGIELNPEYAEIAKRRIEHEKEKTALLETAT